MDLDLGRIASDVRRPGRVYGPRADAGGRLHDGEEAAALRGERTRRRPRQLVRVPHVEAVQPGLRAGLRRRKRVRRWRGIVSGRRVSVRGGLVRARCSLRGGGGSSSGGSSSSSVEAFFQLGVVGLRHVQGVEQLPAQGTGHR